MRYPRSDSRWAGPRLGKRQTRWLTLQGWRWRLWALRAFCIRKLHNVQLLPLGGAARFFRFKVRVVHQWSSYDRNIQLRPKPRKNSTQTWKQTLWVKSKGTDWMQIPLRTNSSLQIYHIINLWHYWLQWLVSKHLNSKSERPIICDTFEQPPTNSWTGACLPAWMIGSGQAGAHDIGQRTKQPKVGTTVLHVLCTLNAKSMSGQLAELAEFLPESLGSWQPCPCFNLQPLSTWNLVNRYWIDIQTLKFGGRALLLKERWQLPRTRNSRTEPITEFQIWSLVDFDGNRMTSMITTIFLTASWRLTISQ